MTIQATRAAQPGASVKHAINRVIYHMRLVTPEDAAGVIHFFGPNISMEAGLSEAETNLTIATIPKGSHFIMTGLSVTGIPEEDLHSTIAALIVGGERFERGPVDIFRSMPKWEVPRQLDSFRTFEVEVTCIDPTWIENRAANGFKTHLRVELSGLLLRPVI